MVNRKDTPFRGLFDAFAEMGRMRESLTHPSEAGREGRTHATAWIPTADIFARGRDLVIRCELAGVGKDELEIGLADNQLCIWGERTGAPHEGEDVSYYVRERHYGPFRRNISLPQGVARSDISALFEDGLLEITVTDAAAPREIERIEIAARDPGAVKLM
jgi:HSP20 family protein